MDDKTLIDLINRKFEEFKETNNKALGEMSKRSGEATGETQEKLEKINKDIEKFRKLQNELEAIRNRPDFKTGNGEQKDPETELRTKAYIKYIRHGMGGSCRVAWNEQEKRALAGTSDADGNFLVPEEFESEIIMNAYELAALRPYCDVKPTGREVVKMGALSKPSVTWGKKGIDVTEQDLNTGGVQIRVKNLNALTLISNDTLDDAEADIYAELVEAFGRAKAEAEDDAFAAGTDEDCPPGIASNTLVQANYVATGVAAALSDGTHNGVDALIDLLYKPKAMYRRNGTIAMNSTTESLVRKLKDGEGKYLWEPSTQAGVPTALLGRPIINPEGLPDVAAGTYPIIFGDFRSGYKIRDRKGLTIIRLTELYATKFQTGFLLVARVGAQVTLPEAFAVLKVAAT